MKKTSLDPRTYVFMSSFLLPEGMLDFFDVVRIDEEPLPQEKVYRGGILHIYLDELDNRSKEQEALIPNGFTEPTLINDFPIRDRKVVLHIRRRRWQDAEGHNVVLNVYNLATKGTRYSEEFAAFLKVLHPRGGNKIQRTQTPHLSTFC